MPDDAAKGDSPKWEILAERIELEPQYLHDIWSMCCECITVRAYAHERIVFQA